MTITRRSVPDDPDRQATRWLEISARLADALLAVLAARPPGQGSRGRVELAGCDALAAHAPARTLDEERWPGAAWSSRRPRSTGVIAARTVPGGGEEPSRPAHRG